MIGAVAIILAGCAGEPPKPPPPVYYSPPPARLSPVMRDLREIKSTVDKLKRKLDKREKLTPLVPPT
jgi:hypothetical protein